MFLPCKNGLINLSELVSSSINCSLVFVSMRNASDSPVKTPRKEFSFIYSDKLTDANLTFDNKFCSVPDDIIQLPSVNSLLSIGLAIEWI